MMHRAGGSIPTCIFVKASTAADHTVLAAGANDMPYGISGEGSRQAPLPSVTDDPPIHAITGEPCIVHSPNAGDSQAQRVMIRCGATVARGAKLMPDANGEAITATTGKYYGAVAEESGVDGELIRVTPQIGLLA